MSANAMRLTEWVLASFDGTGLTLRDRMYAHILMFSFVRGVASALEPEAEAEAIRETGLTNDQWIEERGEAFESLIDVHAGPDRDEGDPATFVHHSSISILSVV
jgi:hypothetical protein